MHRIDGPGATDQNLFTEGDPSQAIPASANRDQHFRRGGTCLLCPETRAPGQGRIQNGI